MGIFRVEVWLPDGKSIAPEEWAVPWPFSDFIDTHWIAAQQRPLVAVHLENPIEVEWREVGNRLLRSLTDTATVVGMYLHSEGGPVDGLPGVVLGWLSAAVDDYHLGSVAFERRAQPHEMSGLLKVEMPNVEDMKYLAIQKKESASWLSGIWSETHSDQFHVDTALMIAAYDMDKTMQSRIVTQALTEALFAESLASAVGWMIPVDSNLGFILGLPAQSELYKQLTAQIV